MFIYFKDPESGEAKEIYGPSIPFSCVFSEAKKVLGEIIATNKLRSNIVTLSKYERHAGKSGFAYIAWVKSNGFIEIRHAPKKNPYSNDQQEEGLYVYGFNGNAIDAEEVEDFLNKGLPGAWLRIADNLTEKLLKTTLSEDISSSSLKIIAIAITEVSSLISSARK